MSDPIAAAEAAGKARDIANRFETAVFLIAYGIAEKDGLYEADPHRYPYSQAFRHGMNILAALCAECSDDAEELLPTFNESDFIRNSAASDVREWTARWRDECREAVEGCRSIEIGPLASVDGDYFAATSECYEVLRFAENDLLGGHQERRVYEFLRAGTQEQYVYGRRMLIRHPLLTWNEYVRIKTGLALGDPDPLDQGEADTIDPVWLQEFVSMAYEPVPGAAKVCPNCGWTMTMRGKQPHCSSATCAKAVTGDFDKLDSVAHDAFRLSRGVMHYISSPGKLELAIAEAAAGLGLKYEMWPLKDTCDILIHLPDGRQLAVDAKAYGRAERLAREIEDDAGIAQMCADEVAYVVPDQVERDHPGYRALCNAVLRGKTGYSCETLRNFSKRLDAAAGAVQVVDEIGVGLAHDRLEDVRLEIEAGPVPRLEAPALEVSGIELHQQRGVAFGHDRRQLEEIADEDHLLRAVARHGLGDHPHHVVEQVDAAHRDLVDDDYLRGVEHLAGPLGAIGGADPRRDFQRAVDRRAVREVQRGDAGGRQGEEIDVARLQVRYESVEHVALARAGVAREEHVPPVPQRAQRLGLFRCKAVTVCHFHIPSSVRPVTGN